MGTSLNLTQSCGANAILQVRRYRDGTVRMDIYLKDQSVVGYFGDRNDYLERMKFYPNKMIEFQSGAILGDV